MKIKTKELKAMVRKQLQSWGLQTWLVQVEVGTLDELAQVDILPEYQQAIISFDLSKIQDVRELRETIEHECLHLVLNAYEEARTMVVNIVGEDSDIPPLLEEVFRVASERSIAHLEFILRQQAAAGKSKQP